MTVSVPEAPSRRNAVFDGVRGVAIILVVLSHGWTLWPTDSIKATTWLAPWFESGNLAVSLFFVVGFFLATRSLLRAADEPAGLRPGVPILRRVIRLSGLTWSLLLVVLIVTALDTTDTYPRTATRRSVLASATYTWNWYVHNNPLEARPDLGHLWYLAVDLQMFLVVLATVWLLRRHRAWLVVALALMLVGLWAWRSNIYGYDPFGALLRTSARGDAPVAGALAASALPYLRRLAPYARAIAVGSAVALVPLVYGNASIDHYFGWPGIALDLTLAAFVIGCTLRPPGAGLVRTLGWRPLAFLGRHSLSLYLWHYPVFWFISRHTVDWRWQSKTLLALGVTAFAVIVSEWLVERRVQRSLASPRWREVESTGLGRYVRHQSASGLRRGWRGLRSRPSNGSEDEGSVPEFEEPTPSTSHSPVD